MRTIELGSFRGAVHDGDGRGSAVLLPGARYPTRAPLLWFARQAAQQRGWSVLEILDELPPGAAPFEWALEVAERALEYASEDGGGSAGVVVIGKSLASIAAGSVADADLPAVWLTPLLGQALVIEGLARGRAPGLLVGGTADETWIPSAIPANPALRTLELDGLDHSLERDGDVDAALNALRTVTTAVGDFLDELD